MASGFSIFAQTFLFYEASHAITVNRYPTISLFLFLHARASAHAHSSNSVRKIYVEKVRNQRWLQSSRVQWSPNFITLA